MARVIPLWAALPILLLYGLAFLWVFANAARYLKLGREQKKQAAQFEISNEDP